MSLINQMLKELDARRSDVSTPGAYGQQVRAVPDRRRHIRPAWIAAAALTTMSAMIVAWVMMSPAAPNEAKQQGLQLPLKLDADLSGKFPLTADSPSGQPVDATNTQTQERNVIPAEVAAHPGTSAAATSPSLPVRISDGPTTINSSAQSRAKGRNLSSDAMMEPTASKVVPSAKALAMPLEKDPAPVPEPTISKQVQSLTPQQRAENAYRKGLQALQNNKLVEATTALEESLQLNPYHVGARYALIGALLDSRRTEEALSRTREGLSLDAAQPDLSMILARLQFEKGELRPAIATLERALPYAADRADYQAFIAALKQRDEQHKQAIEHYLIALRKVPENGTWWMGLGISLQAERRLPEALEAFKRAKSSNNLSPELVAFVDSRLAQLQR